MSEVSWILEVAVKDGQSNAFEGLMAEMVESTRSEPGTIAYEWFGSADGPAVHIYERYADSDATLAHLGNFGEKFAARFLDAVDPTGFTVYGSPDERVREGLAGFGPTYYGQIAGFARAVAVG